jgi:ankyrin repeat protein
MGANVKAFHSESLQAAAENGHLEAVKFLTQRGADVHARNGAAFRNAYHNQKKEVRDYLFMVMKKGAN